MWLKTAHKEKHSCWLFLFYTPPGLLPWSSTCFLDGVLHNMHGGFSPHECSSAFGFRSSSTHFSRKLCSFLQLFQCVFTEWLNTGALSMWLTEVTGLQKVSVDRWCLTWYDLHKASSVSHSSSDSPSIEQHNDTRVGSVHQGHMQPSSDWDVTLTVTVSRGPQVLTRRDCDGCVKMLMLARMLLLSPCPWLFCCSAPGWFQEWTVVL